jgi:hypothetical protein
METATGAALTWHTGHNHLANALDVIGGQTSSVDRCSRHFTSPHWSDSASVDTVTVRPSQCVLLTPSLIYLCTSDPLHNDKANCLHYCPPGSPSFLFYLFHLFPSGRHCVPLPRNSPFSLCGLTVLMKSTWPLAHASGCHLPCSWYLVLQSSLARNVHYTKPHSAIPCFNQVMTWLPSAGKTAMA